MSKALAKKTAKRFTATRLRSDLYRVLDGVIASGVAAEIERKGHLLRIVPDAPPARLERLVARPDFLKCSAEEIVHMEWSAEWRP